MKPGFILIAEDDTDDRFLIQTAFEEKGNTQPIQFVENGVELLSFLQSLSETSPDVSYPHFILLDLNMPKKDGREVLKEIKQHDAYKQIPVIIFTTTQNELEVKRCYELGADGYIVKPISFDSLLQIVDDITTKWLRPA
ncbi:MAG: response regulator [Filimonas sp.]|nr:response regulator [Filimonas sp.]